MESITERNGKWRALVRKAGHQKCETLSTKGAATKWADRVEAEIEELRCRIMQAHRLSLDLIDPYTQELYPAKCWGRSKSAESAPLEKELGDIAVNKLNSSRIVKNVGAQPQGSRAGYPQRAGRLPGRRSIGREFPLAPRRAAVSGPTRTQRPSPM
jgi:hypothetical protein